MNGISSQGKPNYVFKPNMSLENQISEYLESLSETKSSEMKQLHLLIQEWIPNCKLWFETGIDENNKVVSNPNIGYGTQQMHYANGKSREIFQLSISANTTGISVYFIGMKDKLFLSENFGSKLGKAKITGYCIKFKSLKDIDLLTLEHAIKMGLTKL